MTTIKLTTEVTRTARVMLLEGMFDLPETRTLQGHTFAGFSKSSSSPIFAFHYWLKVALRFDVTAKTD